MIEKIGSFLVVLIIFALVLYASYICTRKVAKMSYRGDQSRYMKVEDRLPLGQDKYLALVTIGGVCCLISVTGNGISLLTEIKEEDLKELELSPRSIAPNMNFQELMAKLGKNKDLKDLEK